jgi:hypothetical protein
MTAKSFTSHTIGIFMWLEFIEKLAPNFVLLGARMR